MLPQRNASVTLRVAVHVGMSAGAAQLGVIELQHTLPTFCTFTRFVDEQQQRQERPPPKPAGRVTFLLNKSMKKVAEWVNAHFISAAPLDVLQHGSGSQGSRLCAIFQGIDHEAVGPLWVEAWPASGSCRSTLPESKSAASVSSSCSCLQMYSSFSQGIVLTVCSWSERSFT